MKNSEKFRKVLSSNEERQHYLGMMDTAYRHQVDTLEREKMVQLSRAFHRVPEGTEVTDEQLLSTLNYYKDRHVHHCNAVAGCPILAILGSARNEAVTPYGLSIAEALSNEAVPRNLGMSSGDWVMGYMGVTKYFWLKKKLEYDHGFAACMATPLVGQEMNPESFSEDKIPEWFSELCISREIDFLREWNLFTNNWSEEHTSPPHATFLSRTPTIYYPAQACGKVYHTEGLGTGEEYRRLRLSPQMAPRNVTVDSWRPEGTIPWDYILDEPRKSGGGKWCWNFLLEETDMQVEQGTVSISEFQRQAIIRVSEENTQMEAPEFWGQHRIESETELEDVLGVTSEKETKIPFLLSFKSFELAATFVVQRSYITHRRLAEAMAADLLKVNGNGNSQSA